jgi:hypothetical protein
MPAPSSTAADARAPAFPRLSRRVGFWAVAFAFFTATAFSTAPTSLYGEHLSSITITVVDAVYALGIG